MVILHFILELLGRVIKKGEKKWVMFETWMGGRGRMDQFRYIMFRD